MQKARRGFAFVVVACLAAGCGGSGGGDDGVPPVLRALFLGDVDTNDVDEAFLVDYSAPGVQTKVNEPITAANLELAIPIAGWTDEFMLYTTDHDTPGARELYMVRYDTPGVATRINPPLGLNEDVLEESAFVSPDGQWIAYVADQDSNEVFELFVVNVAVPGISTKLNGTLVTGGDVDDDLVRFGPASDRIFYVADEDTDDVLELYTVALSAPTASTKLNDGLVVDGDVQSFSVAPSGAQVFYLADEVTDEVDEIFRVNLTSPGASTKMNQALVADGDVDTFRVSPDGSRIVFVADAVTDEVHELWVVPNGQPTIATRLNAPFVDALRDVETENILLQFVPNTNLVLYNADQITDDQRELFMVDFVAATPPVRVNAPLIADGDVGADDGVALARPDGLQILYTADQNTDDVNEAFLVNVSTPGVAVQASDTIVAGAVGVGVAFYSADGRFVQYGAEQDAPDVGEVYIVPTAAPGPGTSVKLNAPLPATASISATNQIPIPIVFLLRQLGLQ